MVSMANFIVIFPFIWQWHVANQILIVFPSILLFLLMQKKEKNDRWKTFFRSITCYHFLSLFLWFNINSVSEWKRRRDKLAQLHVVHLCMMKCLNRLQRLLNIALFSMKTYRKQIRATQQLPLADNVTAKLWLRFGMLVC